MKDLGLLYRSVPSVPRETSNLARHARLDARLRSSFTVQSRPLARLVQDDGSRKLPQIIDVLNISLNIFTEHFRFKPKIFNLFHENKLGSPDHVRVVYQ